MAISKQPAFCAITVAIGMALTACTIEPVSDSRRSLGELARDANGQPYPVDDQQFVARKAKLAQIYQQLLEMEPDPAIRTNVEYRLVQINTELYDERDLLEAQPQGDDEANQSLSEIDTLAQLERDDKQLQGLIDQYQQLLQRYPNHENNEHVRYQLSKALAVQGKLPQSLKQMELLLSQYPETQYRAELQFRRGEIYYNLQHYQGAIAAYQAVLAADNNANYRINSIYMTGWAQFKRNQLSEANTTFLQVLDALVTEAANADTANPQLQQALVEGEFQFASLNSRHQNIASDTRRVLAISLSQLTQSQSLLALLEQNNQLQYLDGYRHLLFADLAEFLWDKEFKADAEKTYLAYLELGLNDIWSTRFSLTLMERYRDQGKFASIHDLQQQYVSQYGLASDFWQQASSAQQSEILPHLLQFSEQHARRQYAAAQELEQPKRIDAFADAAIALATYLEIASHSQAQQQSEPAPAEVKSLLNDHYLYAEALFEAQQYRPALDSYADIAYGQLGKPARLLNDPESNKLMREAAYATTVTARQLLGQTKSSEQIAVRDQMDGRFIDTYSDDPRALELATLAAQYAFNRKDRPTMLHYSQLVLIQHGIMEKSDDGSITTMNSEALPTSTELSTVALKQVSQLSQLLANDAYQQELYPEAEQAYQLALTYVDKSQPIYLEMRQLLASSIYQQAQALKATDANLAISQLQRVGSTVPESTYRVSAEFEAINLSLEQQQWQQAIGLMLPFKQRYPQHQYSASIPAKLAQAYQQLEQWDLAAAELEQIATVGDNQQLKREALYSAAELYQKAGNTEQARLAYRSYAHSYPEPYELAQEVRFKMSEFYQQPSDSSKRDFWYRKLINAHLAQLGSDTAPSARSATLASLAAFNLGQGAQQRFAAIRLKAPLQASLKRKQQAMDQAIQRYQQVLDLQLAEYVPQATYQLAEMYHQLADDLMSSERPKQLDALALEEYEILLEELAYPFEEKAIEIHISNSQRAWQDVYDQWVSKSFSKLAELSPALYDKPKQVHEVVNGIL